MVEQKAMKIPGMPTRRYFIAVEIDAGAANQHRSYSFKGVASLLHFRKRAEGYKSWSALAKKT